ncbi:lipoxygenase homology domain-containing protein 1-like isoform X2 [Lineus longissimus]|uniref:lipoxygenase homology domain-containing protein 1-like isoform X2 n=1 Tax=Lineus longissimus TaxID=88925 RepID=UPI002B4D4740
MQRSPEQQPEQGKGSTSTFNRLHNGGMAKIVYFYKDGDQNYTGTRVTLNDRRYRTMDALCNDLSNRMKDLRFGVRAIWTPGGHHSVDTLDGLQNNGRYVCSTSKNKAKGVDFNHLTERKPWHVSKPHSGMRAYSKFLRGEGGNQANGPSHHPRPGRRIAQQRLSNKATSDDSSPSSLRSNKTPKKISVYKNTDHTEKHVLLLNRRTAQSFEQVLDDMSELFRMGVRKLFTVEGSRMQSLSDIFHGPDQYVVCSSERLRSTDDINNDLTTRGRHPVPDMRVFANRNKARRDNLNRTRGKWKIFITTGDAEDAGTTSQVSITIYGDRGNSGPIPLGDGDGETFQSGHIDEFEVSTGNIGTIYKIRVAHDNSEGSPAWFCDEVRMVDINSGEELKFNVSRWLARDQDDGEICKEYAAIRNGKEVLPTRKYQAKVITGDVYNAGTDANVYVTIYGERGDTGVRQLLKSLNSTKPFMKGQSDMFEVEAVDLGGLKRVIIGHDGDGQGNGWFLDKIIIKESSDAVEEAVFPCSRWLDEDEDDGKIVRELKIQEEYFMDKLAAEMWEYERWKFAPKSQIMLFSKVTQKAVRILRNGRVDGLGELDDKENAFFNVIPKKDMIIMLASTKRPKHHLTIDKANVDGNGRPSIYSEFRVFIQPDRSAMFESVKFPVQHINIQKDGYPGDARGSVANPSKQFFVYCRGQFRDDSIIMLCTSMTQTIAIDHNNTLYGTGKRNRMAQFKVKKISSGNVRMFESAVFPDQFIQMRDNKCDCMGSGDSYCHFKVHRYKEFGYVTLESVACKGLFIGLTPDGQIRPTVDTNEKNIWLFPEVIQFGKPKRVPTPPPPSPDLEPLHYSPTPPPSGKPKKRRTPVRTPSPRREKSPDKVTLEFKERTKTPESKPSSAKSVFEDGDWKIWIHSAESASNGDIAMVVYGSEGRSPPTILGTAGENDLFQAGNKDEFKVNLKEVGEVYKIRMELINQDPKADQAWLLKEVKMQDMSSREVLKFKVNRWLSKQHDNLETVRELPAVRPRKEVLPVVTYLIEVATGGEPGSDTDANVYINLYGERGDTGKRLLNRGPTEGLFQLNARDKFEIEAVSLGKLDKCVLSHDGENPGEGWYCEEIIVRETEDAEMECVFQCGRWLDSGVDDKKTEIALKVKEERPVPVTPDADQPETGEWKVWVTTGKEPDVGVGDVVLYVYGEKDHVGPIVLGTGKEELFKAGNIDEFKINLGEDLGKLYKIRIGHDDTDPSGWYLEKVKMRDLNTKELLTFQVNRWMSRHEDDLDIWRELPVTRPGEVPLPCVVYTLEVYTGNELAADTEASVFVNLYGERGDCGKRVLFKSKDNTTKFRAGQCDVFEVEAVHLGAIEKITIGHDGEGPGAGWFLEKIVVTESSDDQDTETKYYFPCHRWLDEGQDDGLIVRDIQVVTVGEYSVIVKTNESSAAPNGGTARLSVYGTKGNTSDDIILSSGESTVFTPGNLDTFEATIGDLGEFYKVRICKDDNDAWESWQIDEIELEEKATLEKVTFKAPEPFTLTTGPFGSPNTTKEVAAIRDDQPCLPVFQYQVYVHTTGEGDAKPLHLTMFGGKGDTGARRLLDGQAEEGEADAKCDVYTLEAVYLDALESLCVGKEPGKPLFLKEICVRESKDAKQEYVFEYNSGLGEGQDDFSETTITLKEIRPLGAAKSGDWEIWTKTGSEDEAGTTGQLFIVFCGENMESEPIPVPGTKDRSILQVGGEDTFNVHVKEDIGELFKVRLGFDDVSDSASWYLETIRLNHLYNGDEYELAFNDWFYGTDDKDSWRELAVLPKNREAQSLSTYTYQVAVYTGGVDKAGTDANVYLTIYGEHGTSGKRFLRKSKNNNNKFENGSVDEFDLEAVDLQDLTHIVIGHDGFGAGSGWFLDKVVIKESEETKREFVFDCNRWLDEGEDDFVLERNLPLTEIKEPQEDGNGWRVYITTGDDQEAGTDAEAMMVIYSDKGKTEELLLQSDDKAKYRPGKTAEFIVQVKESVGVPYKVRLGFVEDTADDRWQIKWVNLCHIQTGTQYEFNTDMWLEVDGDHDRWVELPHTEDAEYVKPLPVYDYEVVVYTADRHNAGTDANVFMEIVGERGDTGRRRLARSLVEGDKFEAGKIDRFEIRSVDLSTLERVFVSHDGKGAGAGWFLDKVVIRKLLAGDQGEEGEVEEVLFPCDRWIDEGEEDGELMVELLPGIEQKSPVEGWQLITTTGLEAEECEAQAVIIVYGDQGHTEPIPIGPEEGFTFKAGQKDDFPIDLQDVGDIYKVRVGFADYEDDYSWFLEELTLSDGPNQKQYNFKLNDLVKVDHESDGWREMALETEEKLPVYKYNVSVYTGDARAAGTDANVYIQIFGERGDTGRRRLLKAINNNNKFEEGQTDYFEVEAVDMGDLKKVIVGHDGEGMGAGWFCEKIIIKTEENSTEEYLFPCHRWLDEGEDDGLIERELLVGAEEGHDWKITTTTGKDKEEGAASTAKIVVTIYGDKGHSVPVPLTEEEHTFEEGKEEDFEVKVEEEIGEVYKVRVGFEEQDGDKSWYLDTLKLENVSLGKVYEFDLSGWIRQDEREDNWREMAVIQEDRNDMHKVYDYMVTIHTSDIRNAGTNANVFIEVFGERGDSGRRRLLTRADREETHDKFESGAVDTFKLEAVDMADLTKVLLGHDGKGIGSGWHVDKVVVREEKEANKRYLFDCDQWIEESDDHPEPEIELPLTKIIETEEDDKDERGDWKIDIVTSDIENSGTDAQVSLTVFGERGATDPIPLGAPKNGLFESGMRNEFDIFIDPRKVGKITKIRIETDSEGEAPGWHLEKIVMENKLDAEKHLEFEVNRWLDPTEEDGDVVREFAAQWPDEEPATARTYNVKVHTADKMSAGTDAHVYIQLFGKDGDSGKRFLRKNVDDSNKFESGHIDEFNVEAVGVGELEKLMIGHDGEGAGAGWYLDKIIIAEEEGAADDDVYVFPCDKWLDDGEDDKKIERDLVPESRPKKYQE